MFNKISFIDQSFTGFIIWVRVFKKGQSNIFFKGRLPQILLGPFLNSLTHFFLVKTLNFLNFYDTIHS